MKKFTLKEMGMIGMAARKSLRECPNIRIKWSEYACNDLLSKFSVRELHKFYNDLRYEYGNEAVTGMLDYLADHPDIKQEDFKTYGSIMKEAQDMNYIPSHIIIKRREHLRKCQSTSKVAVKNTLANKLRKKKIQKQLTPSPEKNSIKPPDFEVEIQDTFSSKSSSIEEKKEEEKKSESQNTNTIILTSTQPDGLIKYKEFDTNSKEFKDFLVTLATLIKVDLLSENILH